MNKTFKVYVREVVEGYYFIEAEDAAKAEEIAMERYSDAETMWDGFEVMGDDLPDYKVEEVNA